MREVCNERRRRITLSLFVAVIFAPSIYGFDLGTITLPALCVIIMSILGGFRFIALFWSLVSILVFWAITCLIWTKVEIKNK